MQSRLIPLLLAVVAVFIAFVSAAPFEKRSKKYKGTATWYEPETQGGTEGACDGVEISSDDSIVALNHEQYGKMSKSSKWCGKEIKITGPEGTAKATIQDACPECGEGDLDLSPKLFKKVAGKLNEGVAEITWELV
ncbi:MAG: RlpA-like double-psi beta-barrel-protein domain-containing protein-containing protein [Benjaminiella poitrasii]|nr:MAG: RlpA-like double-psi beta-barrel-protein domain-containing protein-containing protein [Benjaminiella poitrasii]